MRGGGAFTDEEIQLLRGLPAVANVTRDRITYSDTFKQVCTIRYLAGESPTKIFREAGLPPDLVGYKRIERSVTRWKAAAIKSVSGNDYLDDSEIIARLVERYKRTLVRGGILAIRRPVFRIRAFPLCPKALSARMFRLARSTVIPPASSSSSRPAASTNWSARTPNWSARTPNCAAKSPPPPDPDYRYAMRKREGIGQPRESAIYRRDRVELMVNPYYAISVVSFVAICDCNLRLRFAVRRLLRREPSE